MPTPTKGPRLGGSPAHQRMILANLATNLFEHGRITTTEAKARRLRPFAERLITKAKRDDLHHRRQVLSVIRDKGIVHALFTDIGPRYATRPGGYTRITKVGPRKGDNAPMAVIELVEEKTFAARSQAPAETPAGAAAAGAPAATSAEPEEEPQVTGSDEATTESDQVEGDARTEEAAEVDESADRPADDSASDSGDADDVDAGDAEAGDAGDADDAPKA